MTKEGEEEKPQKLLVERQNSQESQEASTLSTATSYSPTNSSRKLSDPIIPDSNGSQKDSLVDSNDLQKEPSSECSDESALLNPICTENVDIELSAQKLLTDSSLSPNIIITNGNNGINDMKGEKLLSSSGDTGTKGQFSENKNSEKNKSSQDGSSENGKSSENGSSENGSEKNDKFAENGYSKKADRSGSEGSEKGNPNYPWNEVRDTVGMLTSNCETTNAEEKPKRIFQHPPEEYLSNLDEKEEEEEDLTLLVPTPPDGGWGWMVVLGSFMIHVFADGFTYTFGIFYVHLLSHFQVSKAAASWILSILVGVTLGSGPISGALVNRFGCRAVTMGGAVIASTFIFLSIYATSVAQLYVTIGLGTGLGLGLIYLPAIVSVSGYFERRRSFATGIAVCGSGLGTFLFSPLTTLLIDEYSWKGAFIIISGLMLNCAVFGALFRPLELGKPRKVSTASNKDPAEYKQLIGAQQNEESESKAAVQCPEITVDGVQMRHEGVRPNMSEASLQTHRAAARERRRSRRYLSVSTATTQLMQVDLLRINSHGSLNPVLLSVKRGEAGLRMTASQPMFPKMDGRETSPSRTEDEKLHSSTLRIPEYRSRRDSIRQSICEKTPTEHTTVCGYSAGWLDTVHSYMDLTLLSDPIFLIFAVSNFLTSIGFYAPYVFIVDRAQEGGLMTDAQSYNLLSVIGISNTVSRVVLGYISDLKFINRLYLYNVALTLCGIGTWASNWLPTYGGQAFYAAVFGATSGAYVGLTSVVLADLLGIQRLTNAFGLLLLFQGIASVVGPPLCASPYSFTQSYDSTFMLAGVMIAVSGLMLFVVPWLQRREEAKAQAKLKLNTA